MIQSRVFKNIEEGKQFAKQVRGYYEIFIDDYDLTSSIIVFYHEREDA